MEVVTHKGGCHCGRVRFEVQAPSVLDVVICDCSICTKKQNHHFIVPEASFRLLQGAEWLTTYTFETHQAKHTFCKVCGVQSFYRPRSNPDGYGVMPHCLDAGTVAGTRTSHFHGQEWEASMQRDPSIRDRSRAL
eukprot:Colp12_sorted_trinity150504_noHs@491